MKRYTKMKAKNEEEAEKSGSRTFHARFLNSSSQKIAEKYGS
jgi:hypothetical protein